MSVIFPRPLRDGDKIAIISPASKINKEVVESAIPILEAQGWQPKVFPYALGISGTYSGTVTERLSDITEAFYDSNVRAVLCGRGGYGAVHLLDKIPTELIKRDPKWLIGYSDISALHALMSVNGIASLHAPMCRHMGKFFGKDECSQSLFRILRGEKPSYCVDPHPWNKEGMAVGPVVGGNLAVLSALTATPYNIIGLDGTILFLEDIAEPIYKVERIFYQMKLSGVFDRINGLILGQFTEYKPDANYQDMVEMIHDMTSDLSIPVAYDFPIGHVDYNLPLIESAVATLDVTPSSACLRY